MAANMDIGGVDRAELIRLLKRVSELYVQGGDAWRGTSFARAVIAVQRIPDSVLQPGVTKSKLIRYADIGPSTADVILEYIRTGQIDTRMNLAQQAAASSTSSAAGPVGLKFTVPGSQVSGSQVPSSKSPSEKDRTLDLFKSIHGVGDVTALRWYNQGWRTLSDVQAHQLELTHAQQLGLTHRDDLIQRIPRAEITRFREMLSHMFPATPDGVGITWMIAGSYRRGCPDSGDVDLLVQTSDRIRPTIQFMVDRLKHAGSLIGVLGSGDTKFMGIIHTQYRSVITGANSMSVTFGGPARRLDIRIVPQASWPYALLYFTGSADLNKQMRLQAITKGWTLNEYGMTNERGELIPASTERDIFNRLGMDYLEPTERNV